MSSDLVSASAQLRKFHGLIGKASREKAQNSSVEIDRKTPRALARSTVNQANGASNQGCNAGATSAKDDEALVELQRYIQEEPRTATPTAPLNFSYSARGDVKYTAFGGLSGAPAAPPAAHPRVEVVVGNGCDSKLTGDISPLRRRVEATSTFRDGSPSPLSRALADFNGAVGRQASSSRRRGHDQPSSGVQDLSSCYALKTYDTPTDSRRTFDDTSHSSFDMIGAGSAKTSCTPGDDLSWSFELHPQKLESDDTSNATTAPPAPISVSAIRSTYRRRRRKEERLIAGARGPRRDPSLRSSAAAVTDINASTETGDGGSDASRSAIPLLGTCSSALEAAHPDAKIPLVPAECSFSLLANLAGFNPFLLNPPLLHIFCRQVIDGLSYRVWVYDLAQRLDTVSTTRAALKNGSSVILRAALFESNQSQTAEASTTAVERPHADAAHGYASLEEADEDGSSVGYRDSAASVAADMRAEALRCARLVLQSLVNEVLTNSNCIETPPISFWGPSPDQRYAEVLLEPHRRYIEYRAVGLS